MKYMQRLFPGMATEPRRVTKGDTFAEVQTTFLGILKIYGQATADAIREILDIPADGLPAIGRAIGHLSQTGQIEPVDFALSKRAVAHRRPVRVWRLAQKESPTAQR